MPLPVTLALPNTITLSKIKQLSSLLKLLSFSIHPPGLSVYTHLILYKVTPLGQDVAVNITFADERRETIMARCRIDTQTELAYFEYKVTPLYSFFSFVILYFFINTSIIKIC